ncbi:MAG: hypothetical protein ACLR6A_06400, partial [Candidatus Gastranaerophilaceae bacterium]
MNGKGFLKEINNLDDDLIMEAAEAARTGRTGRNIIKFAGMAACVAIFTGVITASVLIEKQKMEKENAGEAAVESSYEMGEKQDNMLEGAAGSEQMGNPFSSKAVQFENCDFTGDGITDRIEIDIPQDLVGDAVTISLTDSATGKVIYTQEFSTDSAGWGKLYLYQQDAKNYLIEEVPQSDIEKVVVYKYTMISFEKGVQTVYKKECLRVNVVDQPSESDIRKTENFYYELNSYLEEAVLLVNTTYGRVKYSEPDNLYIGEKEEFDAFLGEFDASYGTIDERLHAYYKRIATIAEFNRDKKELLPEKMTINVKKDTVTPGGADFWIVNSSLETLTSGEYY